MTTNTQNSSNNGGIDENLYSRQLYVLGMDAMQRMAKSDVLICGQGGLGVEIAKNLILGGLKSVTLFDPRPPTTWNLADNFYLSAKDVEEAARSKKSRAHICAPRLQELNSYVTVRVMESAATDDAAAALLPQLSQFQLVVVASEPDLLFGDKQLRAIAQSCHANNVKLLLVKAAGLCGQIFCDFGARHTVTDTNGEEAQRVMIQSVERSERGVVTCLEESRHAFEDGDYVTFTEVRGMTQLNGCEPRRLKVIGPVAFEIGDTRALSEYEGGGTCVQVKQPTSLDFAAYEEAWRAPEFPCLDFGKFGRAEQLHVAFRALQQFADEREAAAASGNYVTGALPRPWNREDADRVLQLAQNLVGGDNKDVLCGAELNTNLIRLVSYTCGGCTVAVRAVLGSMAAQEAMKAVSGKFTPIRQWFYFDAFECLSAEQQSEPDKFAASTGAAPVSVGSDRYAAQRAIFGGDALQAKLAALNYFIVGAGAIGCELLKNFAMLGVAAPSAAATGGGGGGGKLFITDMDAIEKSNLNRQFLFRPADIQKLKSSTAAAAASAMNPQLRIEAHSHRVGAETEHIYNSAFFARLDGVANALDNVEARRFMDQLCVRHQKPLLESGTLGTKGNTQVIVPHLTESYSSSHDPPEKSIPMCTLKNFPYQIEHAIQWARDYFEGTFTQLSSSIIAYLANPQSFCEATLALPGTQPVEIFQAIAQSLGGGNTDITNTNYTSTFKECVVWARHQFEENFHNQIVQLLFNFPADSKNSSGAPFWSGTKRCPTPLRFDPANQQHADFIVAAANVRAHQFRIAYCADRAACMRVAAGVRVPEFQPRKGVSIATTDAEAQQMAGSGGGEADAQKLETLKARLPSVQEVRARRGLTNSSSSEPVVEPEEFEKDDDSNWHIDFVTAASNLRAMNYAIETADRLKTKQIAGNIIPAIATTTSLVSGLVTLELIKLTQGHSKLEDFKNGFINLALPMVNFAEPIACATTKVSEKFQYTLWSRIELEGDLTVQQLLDYFSRTHGLEVSMISQGPAILFSSFLNPKVAKERLTSKLTDLVRLIRKMEIPPHVDALVIDVCCTNAADEDVDMPYVLMKFR